MGLPVLNFTLWREAKEESSVASFAELLVLVGVTLIIILIVEMSAPFLFYPLALASILGIIILVTIINLLILVIAIRREASAAALSDAILPTLGAVLLTFLEIGAMDLLHTLAGWALPSGP